MRICIDSCVFIRGFRTQDPTIATILDMVGPVLLLTIPRLIALEVTRNLTTVNQIRSFYQLFQAYNFARIVDEPIPTDLVEKYVGFGLPAKADAFIGAFVEWQQIDYLLSDNRHFLSHSIQIYSDVLTLLPITSIGYIKDKTLISFYVEHQLLRECISCNLG